MTKLNKVLSILFIILLFLSNSVFATDINMNLQSQEEYSQDTMPDEEYNNNNNLYNTNLPTTGSQSSNIPSTVVSNSSTSNSDSLGLTNILNILLIVVGVVLILLGIAILIRMHS